MTKLWEHSPGPTFYNFWWRIQERVQGHSLSPGWEQSVIIMRAIILFISCFLKWVEILTALKKKTLQPTCFWKHLFCWLQLTHTRQILWVAWQVNLLRNNWVVENLSSVWLSKLRNPINFTPKIWFEIWFVLESLTLIRDKRVLQ